MFRPALRLLYALYAITVFVLVELLVLCPLIIAAPTLALRRAIGRFSVRALLVLWGIPLRVRGLEHLPAQPSIVVSNHASYLDGLVMTAALPARYTFVVQDGAARWPYIGLVLRRMGVVFVNRSSPREGALQTRALIKSLQGGQSLTIFAEGTFKDAPGLLAFKNGAFLMAARAKVPVVPAAIRGTRQIYGGGHKLPRWGHIDIHIHAPLHAHGDDKPAALTLRDSVRARVLHLCAEPDAVPTLSHQDEPDAGTLD